MTTNRTVTPDLDQMTDAELAAYYDSTHDLSEFEGGEVVELPKTVPETRSVTISVRFSPSELAELEQLAKGADMRVTAFIRAAALAAEEPPVDRAEVMDLVEALRQHVQGTRPPSQKRSRVGWKVAASRSDVRSSDPVGTTLVETRSAARRGTAAARKASATKAPVRKASAHKTTAAKTPKGPAAKTAKAPAAKTAKKSASKSTATKSATKKSAAKKFVT